MCINYTIVYIILFNIIYMKYLIIIIEVFITKNIKYKNVLIQIILMIKTNIFHQQNRKKNNSVYITYTIS